MKRFYIFLFTCLIFSLTANSQCLVTTNSIQANCYQCNGLATLFFSGGTPPYHVNFNGNSYSSPSGSPLTIPNLCPMVYPFVVTDSNLVQCSGSVDVLISTTPPLLCITTPTPPSCSTCSDGSISVAVTGGTPPYTYVWNNGSTMSGLQGVGVGVYSVTVTDAFGCTAVNSVFLGYTGHPYYSIGGRAFFDSNNDGIQNGSELGVPFQMIQLQPAGISTYTNSAGDFLFVDTVGTYTVDFIGGNGYHVATGSTSLGCSLSSTNVSGLNFALAPDSIYTASMINLYCSAPRCNVLVPYYLTITNTGTAPDSGIVQFAADPLMSLNTCYDQYTLSGNTVTVNVGVLPPLTSHTVTLLYLLPGAGNTLHWSYMSTLYDSNGTVIDHDSVSYSQVVSCSFDPNDKSVTPEGVGPDHQVKMNTELQYLIRFQNTGNDTAFHVEVLDTLDTAIDPQSFRLVNTSHACRVERTSGNIFRFIFDDILLPDSSTNEAASHGYICFTTKGKSSNPDPSVAHNTAHIFFDQNADVITNTTMTTFTNQILSVQEQSPAYAVAIEPNPMRTNCRLNIPAELQGPFFLEVTTMSGARTMVKDVGTQHQPEIVRGSLEAGAYLLRITDRSSGACLISKLLVR